MRMNQQHNVHAKRGQSWMAAKMIADLGLDLGDNSCDSSRKTALGLGQSATPSDYHISQPTAQSGTACGVRQRLVSTSRPAAAAVLSKDVPLYGRDVMSKGTAVFAAHFHIDIRLKTAEQVLSQRTAAWLKVRVAQKSCSSSRRRNGAVVVDTTAYDVRRSLHS